MPEIKLGKLDQSSWGGPSRDFELEGIAYGTMEASLNTTVQEVPADAPTITVRFDRVNLADTHLDTRHILRGRGTAKEIEGQLNDDAIAELIAGVGYNLAAASARKRLAESRSPRAPAVAAELGPIPLPQAPEVSWNDIKVLE